MRYADLINVSVNQKYARLQLGALTFGYRSNVAISYRQRNRRINYGDVDDRDRGQGYQPLTLAQLGALLTGADESRRWRLIAEFLEEYRWEPLDTRWGLLVAEPSGTGDERWDVFLAALAEHLAARDGRGAPSWAESRSLRQLWFPFNTRAARVDALVHAPAAFRRRGVYVAAQELVVT